MESRKPRLSLMCCAALLAALGSCGDSGTYVDAEGLVALELPSGWRRVDDPGKLAELERAARRDGRLPAKGRLVGLLLEAERKEVALVLRHRMSSWERRGFERWLEGGATEPPPGLLHPGQRLLGTDRLTVDGRPVVVLTTTEREGAGVRACTSKDGDAIVVDFQCLPGRLEEREEDFKGFVSSLRLDDDVVAESGRPDLPGFFTGLWHGALVLPRLIGSIFWDIEIFADPNAGTAYLVGFVLGVLLMLGVFQ